MPTTLGENIRKLRQSRGLSQDRFAKTIGNNQVNVSAWEIGTRNPSLATVRHIADTFNVPLSSLIPLSEDNEDDCVREVAELLQRDPKVRLLFDRAKYLSPSDLDTVLAVIGAITKERVSNE